LGYKIYKKSPSSIRWAVFLDVIASILLAADVVASQSIGILFLYPEVLLYLGVNVVAIILLWNPATKRKLMGEHHQEYPREYRRQW
jgi:hypothetical protein